MFTLHYFRVSNFKTAKMVFNLSTQSNIGNKFIGELRDVTVQTDRMRFRRNLERIGEILAYEISKKLSHSTIEVETPLGIAHIKSPNSPLVIGAILRAGLPLHQGILNYFDDAENAFVSAYRKHHKDGSFEIEAKYVSCPSLEGKTLILADPMLATGASMDAVFNLLKDYGSATQIHVVAAIASRQGLDYMRRLHPEAHYWIGAIDEELTAKSYIVPGLGDAGDLSYGEKIQE
jgi:uracil phosphoribosyltransferase